VAQYLVYGDDSTIRQISDAEATVLQKLIWFRKGGEVSDQQWRDVIGVLKIQAGRLDYNYLRRWSAELGITDLLNKALGDSGLDVN
jgi:hypothetical protein